MLTLARDAMATRFELVLPGENTVTLRAAGEEALDEIERLHNQLNLYSPQSEVAHLNAHAAAGPVVVAPNLFRLLEQAKVLHEETGGAFDITIGPLLRCWGLMGRRGVIPSPALLAEARSVVGMHLVKLDAANFTVQYERPGVMIDLGAIGKGYAVERAIDLLGELGVTSAFLHGGTSTCYGLGAPPEMGAWNVALHYPAQLQEENSGTRMERIPADTAFSIQYRQDSAADAKLMAVVPLKNESLSVSAIRGKFFESSGKTFGHIIDPRTGQPAAKAIYAAVASGSATETDALSTALLTSGVEAHEKFSRLRAGIRTVVIDAGDAQSGLRIKAHGLNVRPMKLD